MSPRRVAAEMSAALPDGVGGDGVGEDDPGDEEPMDQTLNEQVQAKLDEADAAETDEERDAALLEATHILASAASAARSRMRKMP